MRYSSVEGRKPNGADGLTALPSAVCSNEGQVLFVHSAPLSLCAGDSFPALLSAADRRFFAAGDEDALYAVGRGSARQTVWVTRRLFGNPALKVIFVLGIPPADAAGAVRAGLIPFLRLSPGMERCSEGQTVSPDAAMTCLRAFARVPSAPGQGAAERADVSVRQIACLPPLCVYPIRIALSEHMPVPTGGERCALWRGALYCLAAFLCRVLRGKEITFSAAGSGGCSTLLLTAAASDIPAGFASLETLAPHFPDAPELALAQLFAAQCGLAVDVFVTAEGMLGFALDTCRFDPSRIGLKQPAVLLNAEEARAATEEWCHLLPAAVRECR